MPARWQDWQQAQEHDHKSRRCQAALAPPPVRPGRGLVSFTSIHFASGVPRPSLCVSLCMAMVRAHFLWLVRAGFCNCAAATSSAAARHVGRLPDGHQPQPQQPHAARRGFAARPPPLGLVRAASLAVLRDAATPFAVPSAAALQPPPPTLDVPTHPAAAGGNDARIQIPPRGREAASRSLRPHAFAFPTTMPAAASALHATRQTRLAGAWPTAPDSWLTAAALPPHATTTHIPAWVPHTPDGAARRAAAYSAPQVFDSTTTSLADMLHAQAALYAEAPAAPAPATTGGVEAPGWRLLPASVDGVGGNEQPVPGKVLAPWSPPGAGGTIHNRGASWYGQRALAPVEGGTLQLTAPASQGNAARQALFMAHVAARAPTRRAPAKVWGT